MLLTFKDPKKVVRDVFKFHYRNKHIQVLVKISVLRILKQLLNKAYEKLLSWAVGQNPAVLLRMISFTGDFQGFLLCFK